jgi:hypothetical protein
MLIREAVTNYQTTFASGTFTITAADGWKEISVVGGNVRDALSSLGFMFPTTGTVYLDDVRLTDITSSAIQDDTSVALTAAVPKHLFGMHINQLSSHHNWPATGHGLLRLWDTGTNWRNIQPTATTWSWTQFDIYMSTLQAQDPNCMALYTMGITPQWASSAPNQPGAYGPGSSAPPTNISDWRNYARAVATRYQGKIKVYEVWNEINGAGGNGPIYQESSGSYTQLVQLINAAAEEIRAVDPNALIALPNSIGNLQALDQLISMGAADNVDIITVHQSPYLDPESNIPAYLAIWDILDRHNVNKPLWNTEGANNNATAGVAPTDAESRAAVSRSYITQWLYGISNWNWYAWDIQTAGMVKLSVNTQQTALSPGGIAYRETAAWLVGAQTTSKKILPDGTWAVELHCGNAYLGYLLWNPSGTATYPIPAHWGITKKRDLTGATTNITGATSVAVGPEPILIENAAARTSVQPFEAHINFQPGPTPVFAGYSNDTGQAYGVRTDGLTYGWLDTAGAPTANPNTRNRNNAASPDERYDTLNHVQTASGTFNWAILVPNGAYQVSITAGDPDYYTGISYQLAAEGVVVANGTPSAANRWISGSQQVTVTDNVLNLTSPLTTTANKINFIDIVAVQP